MCIYSDRNQIVQLVNSACTLPTAALTPLVNSKTGNCIAQFPDNVAVINAMACECSVISFYLSFSICMISAPEVNSLLTELDQSTTGTLQNQCARLIWAVGVLVQVAGGN